MKVLIKILQVIGGLVFSSVAGLLLFLLCLWLTKYVLMYPLVSLVVILIVGVPSLIGSSTLIPLLLGFVLRFLCKKNIVSLIVQVLVTLYWTWCIACLPWSVEGEYSALVSIVAVLTTIIYISMPISLIWFLWAFYSEDEF